MPVEAPQISIDPYKSQVPLVQIPQEDLQRAQPMPEQAGYMGKAGSVMAISDSLMKGALKGLQMKEEKKYKTAQAVMGAQDAAISDTKKRYEDSLVTKGPEDAGTKAAWEAYTKTVNEAAEARQAFAVPEKTAKPAKGQKKDKKAADGAPAAGGFGAGLKQFFERNPHIIPELSIIGMKSQVDPKLYGQMTPELMARKAETDDTQRQSKVADIKLSEMQQKKKDEDNYRAGYATFNGLSSEQIASLPPEVKKNYDSWLNSKAALTPMKHSMAMSTYKMPDGSYIKGYNDDPPEGGELVVPGQTPKIGSEGEFVSDTLKAYGVNEKTPPATKAALENYAHQLRQYRIAQTTSGSHEQLVPDPNTGKMIAVQVGNSSTKSSKPPAPPPGFAPLGEDMVPQQGGMTAPPQQGGQAARGGIPTTAPRGSTQFTVGPKPRGMLQEGSLPVWSRPNRQNADGTHSSELSISMGDSQGREVLVPTMVDGKFLTPDGNIPPGPIPHNEDDWKKASPAWKALKKAAWGHYEQTGEQLGIFDNPDDANAYAQVLHSRGERGGRGKMTAPPAASSQRTTTAAGRGAMTPPPTGVKGLRNTGLSSMHVAENTQKIETEKTTRYGKAEDAYKKALAANQKEYEKFAASLLKAGQWNADAQKQQKTALENANKKSAADLEAAKSEIGKWYEQQVHAVGGSMPGENVVTLPDGRAITFPNRQAAESFKRDAGIQ